MSPSKLAAALLSGAAVLGPWTIGCSSEGEAPRQEPPAPSADAGKDPPPKTDEPAEAGTCDAREEDQCTSCTRASCCGDFGTYLDASDVDAFEECAEPCADDECVEDCAAASPDAGAAYDGLVACQTDSCAEPCVCEAADDDTSCLACVKESCCAALVPLVLAADFDEFTLCMEPCTGGACDESCISSYSDAGRAYRGYSDCAFAECPDECG